MKVYSPLDLQYTPTGSQAARFSDILTCVEPLHRVWYVDKDTASTNQDGSIQNPYDSIQDAVNAIGAATSAATFQEAHEIIVNSGTYTENLTIPHRALTITGRGVKIDGNILREIADEEEFGVSSSTWRACLTLNGMTGTRDTHNGNRQGIRVTGTYTEAVKSGMTGYTTHDLAFFGARIDGAITIGADVGNTVTYVVNSRLDGDFTGSIYLQKAHKSQFNGATVNLSYVIYMEDVEFNGAGATAINTSYFTDGSAQGRIINCVLYQTTTWTVDQAAQTVRTDSVTYNTLKNVTWVTNTPTISILDAKEYTSAITWDGAGPYTFTVNASTHKLGATRNLTAAVYESDNKVNADISISAVGAVVVTSDVNFSNASITISRS